MRAHLFHSLLDRAQRRFAGDHGQYVVNLFMIELSSCGFPSPRRIRCRIESQTLG